VRVTEAGSAPRTATVTPTLSERCLRSRVAVRRETRTSVLTLLAGRRVHPLMLVISAVFVWYFVHGVVG
jgi:hypothetical protein